MRRAIGAHAEEGSSGRDCYIEGTDQALELAAAKRRIRQLETELAVARKVVEVFLSDGVSPKGSTR